MNVVKWIATVGIRKRWLLLLFLFAIIQYIYHFIRRTQKKNRKRRNTTGKKWFITYAMLQVDSDEWNGKQNSPQKYHIYLFRMKQFLNNSYTTTITTTKTPKRYCCIHSDSLVHHVCISCSSSTIYRNERKSERKPTKKNGEVWITGENERKYSTIFILEWGAGWIIRKWLHDVLSIRFITNCMYVIEIGCASVYICVYRKCLSLLMHVCL